jgi:tRNA A37 threonylcarbamoyladenosine dehydratase
MQDLDLAPINLVTQDPLLAKLRYQIRKKYKNLNVDLSDELKHIICAYSTQAIQPLQAKTIKNTKNKTSAAQNQIQTQTCEIESKKDSPNSSDSPDSSDLYIPPSSLNCAGFGSSLNITATMGFLMVQAIQEKIEYQLQLQLKHQNQTILI